MSQSMSEKSRRGVAIGVGLENLGREKKEVSRFLSQSNEKIRRRIDLFFKNCIFWVLTTEIQNTAKRKVGREKR